MTPTKPKPPAQQTQARANAKRTGGRPRLGTFRLECMLPAAALAELVRREEQSGVYRTRVAARLLCRALNLPNEE
jgi:hypothetical protein